MRAAVPMALLAAAATGCSSPPGGGRADSPLFVDRGAELGVDFVHESGASGALYLPETIGAGAGLWDYDGDGDLDLYLVQGGWLDRPSTVGDRLYRNDRVDGNGWRLVDVTDRSRLTPRGYGMGLAVGDVDSDGSLDLFLANLGRDELWLGRGDGTFVDATAAAGLGDRAWSTSAVFWDYDRDGRQDLFVTRYVDFSVGSHKDCFAPTGTRDYCKPGSYTPLSDLLYRNLGDGTFERMSRAGFESSRGNGLGVVAADVDEDGWLDLYVANDQMPNALWMNRAGRGFDDAAPFAGVAVNRDGLAEASMGIAAADLDRNGRIDLFSTHLAGETNTFYRGRGEGLFLDDSWPIGLAAPSLPFTAFGVAALDVDNDGWLDLATTTGGVQIDRRQQAAGLALPLQQQDQLFRNQGGTFVDASAGAGEDFLAPGVGRGLAAGDVDNDGDRDLLISNAHGRPRLLIDQQGQRRAWIGFHLLASPGRAAPEGARVELSTGGGDRRVGWVQSGGSFLSVNDPRVLFGLDRDGSSPRSSHVSAAGRRITWAGLRPGRYYTLFLEPRE